MSGRESGKTTLARKIATERGISYVTLDDDQFRRFANDDPGGFVRDLDLAVVDEVQHAPGPILAFKKTVDEDTCPGRFLVTGPAELFKGTISPVSLAGRVETVQLLPFSQAEIEGRGPPSFLSKAFNADFPALAVTGSESDVIARVLTGGIRKHGRGLIPRVAMPGFAHMRGLSQCATPPVFRQSPRRANCRSC